eukprot:4074074-Pyramimonas_sp.AAC.3
MVTSAHDPDMLDWSAFAKIDTLVGDALKHKLQWQLKSVFAIELISDRAGSACYFDNVIWGTRRLIKDLTSTALEVWSTVFLMAARKLSVIVERLLTQSGRSADTPKSGTLRGTGLDYQGSRHFQRERVGGHTDINC